MPIKHAELFAGIGGFSLAAQWMGWENIFQVEIDEWCRNQLKKNFVKTQKYGDIREFKGEKYKGKIDILSGGFPCQPFSYSGKRKGQGDDRHLWPEMLRVCKEIRPKLIVAENVPGIISMELDNMLADLENQNYTCWPPFVIPACSVGADHKRQRVWVVAHSNGIRFKPLHGKQKGSKKKRRLQDACSVQPLTAKQFQKRHHQPLLFSNKDGLPQTMDIIKTLKAMGNAIVPQIAYNIFNHIQTIIN